jgi:hypothetical protein
MPKFYKLNEEIKQFIIQHKMANQELSCRGLVSLVEERFQLALSKSSINSVILQHKLSSPVGRRKSKEVGIVNKPVAKPFNRQYVEFMENGGFYFLRAADIGLSLTLRLAKVLSGLLTDLSAEDVQEAMECSIYGPFFKDKRGLWLLMGKEPSQERIDQYSRQIAQIPIHLLNDSLGSASIGINIKDSNDLYHKCLIQLNSFITDFFPREYQFLSFSAMRERFYCLPAKLERKGSLLVIQLCCPAGFFGINDVIWHEGFSQAVNGINEAKILTPEKEQIWFNPQVQLP